MTNVYFFVSPIQVPARSGKLARWWPPASHWRHSTQRCAHHTYPPARCHTPSTCPVARTKHSEATRGRQRAASEWPTVATHTQTHTLDRVVWWPEAVGMTTVVIAISTLVTSCYQTGSQSVRSTGWGPNNYRFTTRWQLVPGSKFTLQRGRKGGGW